MLAVTRKQGRVAAVLDAALLAAVAVWLLLATLHAAFGANPPPTASLVLGASTALLALGSAAVLLIRAGYWRQRVSFDIGRTFAPWVAYGSLGGAVLGFAGEMDAAWYFAGPVNLLIALLAFVVARSPETEGQVRRPLVK